MRRILLLALLAAVPTACSQPSGGGFSQVTPSPPPPASPAQLDLGALATVRAGAYAALLQHLPGGNLDLTWGQGAASELAGPYSDAVPESNALALQALKSEGGTATDQAPVATATADAFKVLEGPRGGAYLLLADAAHPPAAAGPNPAEATPPPCPVPAAGQANPACLRRQVSDGLLAAYYAADSKMFFKVGETSTVYRPVDAITVGCALVVAGFQQRDEQKISAGSKIVERELKVGVDDHYGMLAGLVTATAQGGHDVTDHNTRLADQAGAAEALLEAFDYSREQQYMAGALKLLQPLLAEQVPLRAPAGGYISGFDLQASGPREHPVADVEATLLVLQAARHYDRDDGGHFSRLEESAASALTSVLDADRRAGADPGAGLPARLPAGGVAVRSGLTTALAVVVLGDVARDLPQASSPSPGASPSL